MQVLADLVARSVRAFRKVENLRLERKMLRAFLLVRSFKREAHRPEAQLLLSTAKGLYRALEATAGYVWAGYGQCLRCAAAFGAAPEEVIDIENGAALFGSEAIRETARFSELGELTSCRL